MPGEAPGGRVVLMFAGGGDLRVDVECMDAVLADLSERWPRAGAPTHLEEDGSGVSGPHRLSSVDLDAASLPSATAEIEHERRVAIFDLVEKNSFEPASAPTAALTSSSCRCRTAGWPSTSPARLSHGSSSCR